MKLYEIDVPETQKGQRDEEEKDRTNISPFASGAESHRGKFDTTIWTYHKYM